MSESSKHNDNKNAKALAAARGLHRSGVQMIAYLPSTAIAPIINYFRTPLLGKPQVDAFPVGREEEAIGIIGAVNLAGGHGSIVMQDNGFGNSLTALATWAFAYHLPLPIIANTRGGLGEYNSMIHTFSAGVPEMLRAINIPVFTLDRRNGIDDWEATVVEVDRLAWITHRPVVALLDFWDGAQ